MAKANMPMNRLGIGPSPEGRGEIGVLKLLADEPEVVDLSVEGDDVTPGGGNHRLMALLGKVEDGETAESQRYAAGGVSPLAVVVGTAMDYAIGHPGDAGAHLVLAR
jgi:hypothetical protein